MNPGVYPQGRRRGRTVSLSTAAMALPGPPIRVHHPLSSHLVLRTSADWHRDLLPVSRADDGGMAEFRLPARDAAWACKPCLRQGRHHLLASDYDVPLTGAL